MKLIRITAAAVCAALLLCLAACGGSPEELTGGSSADASPTENASDTAAKTTGEETNEPAEDGVPFDFDVSEYVDLPDVSAFSLKRSDVDEKAAEYLEQLTTNYPVVRDKTEGTIENGDTAEIYYKGTLIVYEGAYELKMGSSGFAQLDVFMAKEQPENGVYKKAFRLEEDFKLPETMKRENDLLEKELSGKEVTLILTNCPAAFPAAGESFSCNLRLEYVFSGGTFDEKSDGGNGHPLTIGSGSFIPGFEEGMIGMDTAPGTKRTVTVFFPDPYQNNKALSGEKTEFAVTVVKVTVSLVCDLDNPEQFALFKENYLSENGEGSFDYTDKAGIMADYEKRAKAELGMAFLDGAVSVKKEHEELLEEYKNTVKTQYLAQYQRYYYQFTGKIPTEQEVVDIFFAGDRSTLDEKVYSNARSVLYKHLTYFGVARKLGIADVTDQEIDEYLQDMADKYTARGYEVTKEELLTSVYGKRSEVYKEIVLERLSRHFAENVAVTA